MTKTQAEKAASRLLARYGTPDTVWWHISHSRDVRADLQDAARIRTRSDWNRLESALYRVYARRPNAGGI